MSLSDLREYMQTDWMTDLGFTKKYGANLSIARVLIGSDRVTAQRVLEKSADWVITVFGAKVEELFSTTKLIVQEQYAFDAEVYDYALTDEPGTR